MEPLSGHVEIAQGEPETVTMFDGVSVVDVLLPTVLFYHAMLVFFFSPKGKKPVWLDRTAMGLFISYWIVTIALAEPVRLKVFTTLLLLSLLIVRFLVGRKRKASAQKPSHL